MTRSANEATAIQFDDAETSTTSAPTLATDGAPVPQGKGIGDRAHLQIEKGAASGTRTARVKVFGYRSVGFTVDETEIRPKRTEVSSSGAWLEIFDTGTLSDAADFDVSFALSGVRDFARVATQVITNGGTTPTLTSYIAFAGAE